MDSQLNIDIVQICRTCLKEITSGSSFFYMDYSPEHTQTIRQKLNNCIPELDLSIVSDVVICSKCADAIKSFYEFKHICLESEIQLNKYIQQVQHAGLVNLIEVVQLNQSHNSSLNMKIKMEDIEITEDIKTEDLVCDTDGFNEATESAVPTYVLTIEKHDGQYVLFNTVEKYIDNSLSAAEEHVDINNSKNLSKKDSTIHFYQKGISKKSSKNDNNLFCYYGCSSCNFLTKYKCLFSVHNRIHLTKKGYIVRTFQHKDIQTKPFVTTSKVNKRNVIGDKIKYINHHYNQHYFKNRSKHLESTQYFGHQSNLKHNTKVNVVENPFKCLICEYQCKRREHLTRHMRLHTGEKPFLCSICGYQCSQKSKLMRHIQIHTGNKPFSCSICEYQCSRKEHLEQHTRTHTGEKPFVCSICEYQCNWKPNLTRHMRLHAGEKPFACSVCDYRCSQKSRLKRHIRIHTGEKPFSCSLCEYKCNRNEHLKQHMRTHTN